MLSSHEISQSTSFDSILGHMQVRMKSLVPDFEMESKARLIAEINEWKKERNALVLGHNYMEPALYHMVSDVKGDSLELCRLAAATDKPILVFCGVEFMAETAKIINPERKVLIPSQKAGCSLASSITRQDVIDLKNRYPGVPVVTYINTYADVKAETDVCCTSGNAAKVVASLDSDTVIFIPDEYLARNVARETGKKIIFPDKIGSGEEAKTMEKVFVGWHGKCEVHDQFTVDDILQVRKQFPDTVVLAHPECPPDVVEASDYSGSTSAMIKYVKDNDAKRYLLLTECAMADNIIATMPDKDVLRLCSVRCPHMAQITLEDTLDTLKYLRYEVEVDPEIIPLARRSIDRMLAIN